ncbi:MAG: hypothetical protein AB4058_11255 [Microcystaceae cyanobacterium]
MILLTLLTSFQYQRLIFKTTFWAVAEIWLSLLGIDDLADYSEFLLDQDKLLYEKNHRTVESGKTHRIFCKQINETCPVKVVQVQIDSCLIDNDYFYYYTTFKNKCLKVKSFCMKAELLSQIV